MNVAIQEIETMPTEVQREVLDFALFLMSKKLPERKSQMVKQGWAGALREFKDQYTSLILQKQSQEWRV